MVAKCLMCTTLSVVWLLVPGAGAQAQPARTSASVVDHSITAPQGVADEPTLEKLREQIQKLSSPSYRTRQLAIWYLEQNPKRALPLLREAGKTTDLNIGAEIISMLSTQAMMTDLQVSVEAHEALKDIAGGANSVTAVSQLANNALEGIADRQEILAVQALRDLNVQIGQLRLNINGSTQNDRDSSLIVYVTDDFKGHDEHLRLFRFIRSCDTAYLEGPAVSEKMLREVLAMPSLSRLILRGPAINNAMLAAIFDIRELEHLELVYTPIDDSAIDTIVDLPIVGSLRITGAKMTEAGRTRLKQELDGLEVYVGRGGFLGVKTNSNNLLVLEVVPGSGAQLGGIQAQDTITHINDKPIKVFDQLRAELANFEPGDKVTINVLRFTMKQNGPATEEVKLEITLGYQETKAN